MNYDGQGRVRIAGCAGLGIKDNYETQFQVGSKAYIKRRAELGIVEPVFIKRINRVYPRPILYRGVVPQINYVDTLNRVWVEDELCAEATAVEAAKASRIRRRMLAEYLCTPPKTEGCD
jgi:hypothetical protein